MKLFLFGGAEIGMEKVSPDILKKLIKETLVKLQPKNILLVPFARLHPTEEEWKEGWFKELMSDTGIEILDARNESDIEKTSGTIFVNGGHGRRELINNINNNKKLLSLIMNTQYFVSESSGSMVTGEYMRANRENSEIIKGLGLLKNTIIEPHYTERQSQQLLINGMKKSGMKYGVGIDCATALVIDPQKFPDKWEKIGVGNIYIQHER